MLHRPQLSCHENDGHYKDSKNDCDLQGHDDQSPISKAHYENCITRKCDSLLRSLIVKRTSWCLLLLSTCKHILVHDGDQNEHKA